MPRHGFVLVCKRRKRDIDPITVDREMCAAFGRECHPERWHRNWYNLLGPVIATGGSWDDVRNEWPEFFPEIDWLEQHFYKRRS